MRKQNFIQWKMNAKRLSRKSGKNMVGVLKQRMGVLLVEVFVSFDSKRIHIEHGIIGAAAIWMKQVILWQKFRHHGSAFHV